MNFTHQHTFLRSALVKDPFSLGDLGPEDVLRIESEFPNLFDTSDTTVNLVTDSPKLRKQVTPVPVTRAKSQHSNKINAIHKCCDCKNEERASPAHYIVTQGSTRSWKPMNLSPKASVKLNPIPKTCLTPDIRRRNTDRVLSVTDLKRVLEEVLWQKDLKQYHKETPEIKAGIEKLEEIPRNYKCKTIVSNNISRGFQNSLPVPKNYENMARALVNNTVFQNISKSKSTSREFTTAQKNELLRKAVTNLTLRSTAKLKTSSPMKLHGKSMPGFLRPAIKKITSSCTRPSSKTKKSVKFSRDTKEMSKTHGAEKHTEPSEKKNKDPLPAAKDSPPKNSEDYIINEVSNTEMKIRPGSSKQIILKGHGKYVDSEGTDQMSDPVASSYQQLKLARNLASKYEKIGLLRKINFKKELIVKSDKPATVNEYTFNKSEAEQEQAPMPIVESVLKQASTSNVLAKLAKELVYVEILKYLDALQIEKPPEIPEEQFMRDVDESKLILESGNQIEREDLFNLEWSDVKLSTPELSSLTSLNSSANRKVRSKSVSKTRSCDSTPNLTLSVRRKKNIHDCNDLNESHQGNNNDNTDCSEMSDFVFSEKELKLTPKSFKSRSDPFESKKSIITPQSSSTNIDIAQKSRGEEVEINPLHQVRSTDTLNIASEFDYSPAPSSKKQMDVKVSSSHSPLKVSKHLSLVTEELSVRTISPAARTRKFESEFSKSQAGSSMSISQLQKSQSEMLSEGEFIGNVYKSPGEVSLSQPFSPSLPSTIGSKSNSTLMSEAVKPFPNQVGPDLSNGEYL